MRRHTERTEQQVAVQRYTHLLTLPDRELCQQWHRAKPLPADHGGCTYWLITPDSSTTPCRRGGERWAIQDSRPRRPPPLHPAHGGRDPRPDLPVPTTNPERHDPMTHPDGAHRAYTAAPPPPRRWRILALLGAAVALGLLIIAALTSSPPAEQRTPSGDGGEPQLAVASVPPPPGNIPVPASCERRLMK
jgi:hypothetical protein